ncbi:WD40/YVTN/BNR-like repeat-containing protein [Pseudomonas sp. ABY48]|uniref:WD40/YVTN/BNR-like repeat-containing protein n=1 Tax=Pseudomonas sp. ABY48 TaxID=3402865 RepID=UPI003B428933
MKLIQCLSCALLILVTPVGHAESATVGDALSSPATLVGRAQQAVFIDMTQAGDRLVAVGERGLVLLSDDQGQSWRQANVPVSVSLTSVRFVDASHGWAVGHAGVILATSDGGESWSLLLDGVRAARLEVEAARLALPHAADAETAEARLQTAERMLAEGADKPFLSLAFSDVRHGVVVGAYGMALRTDDGGQTWHSIVGQIDNPIGLHLYAITRSGQDWFLAGEQGYLARSVDGGDSFSRLESPYEGSFFTLIGGGDGALFAAGLKGHAFVSHDRGEHFEALPIPVPLSLIAATAMNDGGVLLANQGGMLFRSVSGTALDPFGEPLNMPVSSVVQTADGSLVVAGFAGLTRLPLHTVSDVE